MIIEIFTYAVSVASFAGLAALCVERLLAEMRCPRRLAWLGAYVVALALPLLSPLWATSGPPPAASLGFIAVDTLTAPAQMDWGAALLWLWATATTLLLSFYATAWTRLARMSRRWAHVPGADGNILIAEDVGPAVFGIFRPRVVLPSWLMHAPESARSIVVTHEREHIAARDQTVIVAAHLIAILLPWNLPLWWFAKRLRVAIEIDCDARVLRRGMDPAHYADVLLTVGQHGTPSPYLAATLIEPVTQLERRIRILLTQRPRSVTHAATAAVLTVALAACATQITPPVLPTNASTSRDSAGPPPRINVEGSAARMQLDPDTAATTLLAPRIVMTLTDSAQMQVTADRANVYEGDGTLSLEGNVQFNLGRTVITASRALAKKETDGSTTWQVDDVQVVRSGVDTAPSSK
jgi:hypothetical protein